MKTVFLNNVLHATRCALNCRFFPEPIACVYRDFPNPYATETRPGRQKTIDGVLHVWDAETPQQSCRKAVQRSSVDIFFECASCSTIRTAFPFLSCKGCLDSARRCDDDFLQRLVLQLSSSPVTALASPARFRQMRYGCIQHRVCIRGSAVARREGQNTLVGML